MKEQKTKIIILIGFLVIVLLGIGVYFGIQQGEKTGGKKETKINLFYQRIVKQESYQFNQILDEENYIKIMKKGENAYKEEKLEGEKSSYLVKDHNTYLLQEAEKAYYTYENNEDILSEIVLELEDVISLEAKTGKETIEGKRLEYEEYEGVSSFLMGELKEENKNAKSKTRFYFEGEDLKYIKIIIGNQEELSKIDFSNQVQEEKFEIPLDYTNANT